MSNPSRRFAAVGAGMAYALLLSVCAEAQDVEIFLGNNNPGISAKPNILLILDNSQSMDAEDALTQNDFDPIGGTYTGTCDESRVYWGTNGIPPDCSTTNYFNMTALKCGRALTAFTTNQGGVYNDVFAQYDPTQDRWETIAADEKDRLVECQDDLPDASIGWSGHGVDAVSSAVYPKNGDNTALWTSDVNDPDRIVWGTNPAHQTYQLYSGKYLNWYYGPATLSSRIDVMKDVATNFINSMNGVNVGLMYFDGDEGGLVAHEMEDVSMARSDMASLINGLTANASTPLSETLYEAYQYFRGGQVVYGDMSVAASRLPSPNDNIYDSPIDMSCQKNHIVYLTDGWPVGDGGADSAILGLTDAEGDSFSDLVGGTCDVETHPSGLNPAPSGGDCLDELAQFMHDGDLSLLPGQQNVTTHTVGFLVDLPILSQTAARGGGEYRVATDSASLTTTS